AKQIAEHANQAKSRYISNISHELRTPLNSILGYAQLLDEDQRLPEHVRHAVGVIKRGGDHLLSLIEGTLDMARIESGKLTLSPKPIRLRDMLDQIVAVIEPQARQKGLRFISEFSLDLPEVVRADERRVRQILINVLGNAVKFTQVGQVSFKIHYAREMARIEITDSGPGIAPEELDKVFEPFERGSSAAGQSAGGTGLGLTISKMLTDLMGGELQVVSEIGSGTTFRIRLFLPQVRQAVDAEVRPRGIRTGYAGVRRRIWVVDNEEADRGLLVRILKPLGFDVTTFESGLECLAMLRHGPATMKPDAIFMDLAMPGLDGWATLGVIQAEQLTQAPVAIVSANAFERGADNPVGLAADDFLVKPVRVTELLDWLGRRLSLDWVEVQRPPPPPSAGVTPSAAALSALAEQVEAGYVRGVHRALDHIAQTEPQCENFVASMRDLVRRFQLDTMAAQIRDHLSTGSHQNRTA
ncbi:MAG TPA: ATP-binding protein, partial [Aquabacterium sp.]|nr:ATP-binding protein [Aquabacterium sp.]